MVRLPQNSIPARCAGMLFFFALVCLPASADIRLALELVEQGDLLAARREATRAVQMNPGDDRALLLAAEIALSMRPDDEAARRVAVHLSENVGDTGVRARAAYLAGRSAWTIGDRGQAWRYFSAAFRSAEDRDLFLRSGCALFLLRREDARLGEKDVALLQQLASCRNLWTFELRDEVRPATKATPRGGPATWMVGFYRAQIGPAIGHRCVLDPSCSEYFLQASRAHGWVGMPMIGDRLVREPGVVQAAEEPVERNGMIRFRDPVENHTFWFRK